MSVLRAEQHLLQHSVEHAIRKKGMRSKGDKKKKKSQDTGQYYQLYALEENMTV